MKKKKLTEIKKRCDDVNELIRESQRWCKVIIDLCNYGLKGT